MIFNKKKITQKFIASTLLLSLILLSSLPATADSKTASLSLSPSAQTVTNGSKVTMTLVVNPEGNLINTVQTNLSYPSENLSLVKAVGGPKLGDFIDTPENGSLIILAASATPVSSTSPVTVATITFKAKNSAVNNFDLAKVCPTDKSGVKCSAVYDSTTNNNVLSKVVSPAKANVKLSLKSVSATKHVTRYLLYGLFFLIIIVGFILFGFSMYAGKKHS
jgi:hypothetical protein